MIMRSGKCRSVYSKIPRVLADPSASTRICSKAREPGPTPRSTREVDQCTEQKPIVKHARRWVACRNLLRCSDNGASQPCASEMIRSSNIAPAKRTHAFLGHRHRLLSWTAASRHCLAQFDFVNFHFREGGQRRSVRLASRALEPVAVRK